ncbi:hypothetical protein C8Q75DRAFT_804691 [Abortiporus biennis]|nr:hypothetical protein C8Q75DRAFT_804691 [Abortiporus biennis]
MSQNLHDPDRSSGRDSIESITDSWSSDDRTILDSSPRRRISSSTSVFPFRFANGDIWSTGTSIFFNTTQFVVGAVGMKYLRIVRPNKLRRSVTAWGVLCGSQTIGGTVAYKAENKFNRDRKNPGSDEFLLLYGTILRAVLQKSPYTISFRDFDADSQKYCKEVLEKSDSIIWERLWKERSMPLFLTWSSKIWSSQDARVFNVGIPVFALNSHGIKTNFRYTDLGISATHFANAEQFTKRVYTLWLPSAAIMYISFFCQLFARSRFVLRATAIGGIVSGVVATATDWLSANQMIHGLDLIEEKDGIVEWLRRVEGETIDNFGKLVNKGWDDASDSDQSD